MNKAHSIKLGASQTIVLCAFINTNENMEIDWSKQSCEERKKSTVNTVNYDVMANVAA